MPHHLLGHYHNISAALVIQELHSSYILIFEYKSRKILNRFSCCRVNLYSIRAIYIYVCKISPEIDINILTSCYHTERP